MLSKSSLFIFYNLFLDSKSAIYLRQHLLSKCTKKTLIALVAAAASDSSVKLPRLSVIASVAAAAWTPR